MKVKAEAYKITRKVAPLAPEWFDVEMQERMLFETSRSFEYLVATEFRARILSQHCMNCSDMTLKQGLAMCYVRTVRTLEL